MLSVLSLMVVVVIYMCSICTRVINFHVLGGSLIMENGVLVADCLLNSPLQSFFSINNQLYAELNVYSRELFIMILKK